MQAARPLWKPQVPADQGHACPFRVHERVRSVRLSLSPARLLSPSLLRALSVHTHPPFRPCAQKVSAEDRAMYAKMLQRGPSPSPNPMETHSTVSPRVASAGFSTGNVAQLHSPQPDHGENAKRILREMYQEDTKKGRGRDAFQSLEVVLVDDAKGKRGARDNPAPDFFSADVTGTHVHATGHCTECPLLHVLLLHLPSHVGINTTLRPPPPTCRGPNRFFGGNFTTLPRERHVRRSFARESHFSAWRWFGCPGGLHHRGQGAWCRQRPAKAAEVGGRLYSYQHSPGPASVSGRHAAGAAHRAADSGHRLREEAGG